MALQSILAPGAYIGGYILLGMMVGGVGALLGLIWIFSRLKWGRKYWWALLLGIFLLQIIAEQYGHAQLVWYSLNGTRVVEGEYTA